MENIVIVVDEFKKISSATIANNNMEGNSEEATMQIVKCVEEIAPVILYANLEDFCNNITRHKKDLLFPLRYGTISRTEKGLIPSLCQANNISYIGADVYTQILCNDKHLAKLYAKEFGFSVPIHFLCRQDMSQEFIEKSINNLHFPVVVKPNYGGGSSGISQNNIVYSITDAIDLVQKLFMYHSVPVMVEEYIPGYEVSLLLIGNKNNSVMIDETQLIMNGNKYFSNEIWGYETKKIDDSSVDYARSNLVSEMDKKRAHQLFNSFDKVEYMRIDGRVYKNCFYVLELSPDCYLGPDSDFAISYEQRGKTYADFIHTIIKIALNHD